MAKGTTRRCAPPKVQGQICVSFGGQCFPTPNDWRRWPHHLHQADRLAVMASAAAATRRAAASLASRRRLSGSFPLVAAGRRAAVPSALRMPGSSTRALCFLDSPAPVPPSDSDPYACVDASVVVPAP
jgi:hypothetical protein